MVSLARVEGARYPGLVEVRQYGWEKIDEVDAYDVAIALGVFDYVDQPDDLLRRMGRAAPHVLGSFPAPGLRLQFRRVRYGARGVHVHGRRPADLSRLATDAGLEIAELHPLGQAGYAVHFRRPTPCAVAGRQPPWSRRPDFRGPPDGANGRLDPDQPGRLDPFLGIVKSIWMVFAIPSGYGVRSMIPAQGFPV